MKVYEIKLKKVKGGYCVEIPIYDVLTQGRNIDECIYMAKDLIKLMEEDYLEEGNEIPKQNFTTKTYVVNEKLLYIFMD